MDKKKERKKEKERKRSTKTDGKEIKGENKERT
jgi:hypothetical protein